MNKHNNLHHMDEIGIYQLASILPQFIFTSLFCLLLVLYICAMVYSNRRYKRWPIHRTICWSLGILCELIAVVGPLANRAHTDFTAHMVSHLLLGMLAPLLLVVAAPITLLLRTLSTSFARSLSSLLKSSPVRVLTHPIVATFLNIGGLLLLYTTDLYVLMHDNILVYIIVHFHLFLAGYVFTISMIYVDPIFHRKTFLYRAVVLIVALAGHGILSKYLYAHPPLGVTLEQAELGSMIMYYGGDAIDAMIIFLLCLQWYKASRPRVLEH